MKNFIHICIFLFASANAFSQIIVGKVDINSMDSVRLVEVFVERSTAIKSVDVYLDYGQNDNSNYAIIGVRNTNQRIMDPATNSKMIFRSTVSVLSFMEKNGWEHYESVALREGSRFGVFYYFKRKPL